MTGMAAAREEHSASQRGPIPDVTYLVLQDGQSQKEASAMHAGIALQMSLQMPLP